MDNLPPYATFRKSRGSKFRLQPWRSRWLWVRVSLYLLLSTQYCHRCKTVTVGTWRSQWCMMQSYRYLPKLRPEHHLNVTVHWQDSLPVQPSILEFIIIQVICSGFLFYPVSPFPAPCYRSDLLSPVLSLTVVTHRIIGLPQWQREPLSRAALKTFTRAGNNSIFTAFFFNLDTHKYVLILFHFCD